ncbi:MAG: Sec-independent protein translocase protein TatB [Bosea sp. (in: a-proteobacteria)]
MFDIAWSELMLIGAVALVVIGPKDLPKAMRTVGQTVGKLRRMAGEFQGQFNEAMREAELHDLKKQVEDVGGSVSTAMNPEPQPAFKPIDDFKPSDALADPLPTGADDMAMKEAEALLAKLPGPEPLPDIVIEPAPIAAPEPEPAPKPKRVRKPKQVAGDDGSTA